MSVYFIQSGHDGPIKIGTAADPHRRLCQLQTGHHEPLKIIAVADGDQKEERKLHERFAASRVHGEWFRASADVVAYIRNVLWRSSGARCFAMTQQELDREAYEAAEAVYVAFWVYHVGEESEGLRAALREFLFDFTQADFFYLVPRINYRTYTCPVAAFVTIAKMHAHETGRSHLEFLGYES
jgi:hypothetical protein